MRFDYERGDGESSSRLVQPHQLVTAGRRWYLLAWDHRRADWRTFRLDRLREPGLTGTRFTPRQIPGGDAASFIAHLFGLIPRHLEATLAVNAAFAELEGALRWVDHAPIETAADWCLLQVRADDLDWLSMIVARIALAGPVTVIEPVVLRDAVRRLASRLTPAP